MMSMAPGFGLRARETEPAAAGRTPMPRRDSGKGKQEDKKSGDCVSISRCRGFNKQMGG
jgi:hypothetical protein